MFTRTLRLRITPDRIAGVIDADTGKAPEFWSGSPAALRLAFFAGPAADALRADFSDLLAVELQLKAAGSGGIAPADTAVPLASSTTEDFNDAITIEDWASGEYAHCEITLTGAQLNRARGKLWAVLVAHRISSTEPLTLAAGPITLAGDGYAPDAGDPPPAVPAYPAPGVVHRLVDDVAELKDENLVLTEAIAEESAERAAADNAMATAISDKAGRVDLASEVSRAISAESALGVAIGAISGELGGLAGGLSAEIGRATGAEGALRGDLDSEILRAKGVEGTKQDLSKKGAANGYAPLDEDAQVPRGYLPVNLITSQQLAGALAGYATIADISRMPSPEQKAALDGANNPHGGNPFATIRDIEYIRCSVIPELSATYASFYGANSFYGPNYFGGSAWFNGIYNCGGPTNVYDFSAAGVLNFWPAAAGTRPVVPLGSSADAIISALQTLGLVVEA